MTPYIVDFTRAAEVRHQLKTYGQRYDMVALACASQMGKTDGVLDVIGATADQRPSPILYVGPTQDFVRDEISPRLQSMLKGAPGLAARLSLGKALTQFKALVGGVPIRLAWAGSAAQVAGMAARVALADEIDRMDESVQGEGDPLKLIEARGFSFADRVRMAISTPLTGAIDTEFCELTGLEYWRRMPSEDVQSRIWRLFQSGTMHHWVWPCPECGEHFVPRFKTLVIPEGVSDAEARRAAHVQCPHCEAELHERHKAEMNRRGFYIAPGQVIEDGRAVGPPPDSTTLSFFASGLASPFVSFGDRAAAYVRARLSGLESEMLSVINTGFGECYAPGAGDVPEWQEVQQLARDYRAGAVPGWVQRLTLAVDVQRTGLYFTVRGWGAYASSATIDRGFLSGVTHQTEVWDQLASLIIGGYGDLRISLGLVDSGFRPGDPKTIPVNAVYAFCRRFKSRIYPSKGVKTQTTPVKRLRADLNRRGEVNKYGLDLIMIDTHHAKSAVHEKVRWEPGAPGEWVLPRDIDEAYCRQIVSEACTRTESGAPEWKRRSRDNHYLDCEAMQEAIGHWIGAHRLRPQTEEAAAETAATKSERIARIRQLAARNRARAA